MRMIRIGNKIINIAEITSMEIRYDDGKLIVEVWDTGGMVTDYEGWVGQLLWDVVVDNFSTTPKRPRSCDIAQDGRAPCPLHGKK